MVLPVLRPLFLSLALLIIGVACEEDALPAEPVVRAGEIYTCSNGLDGCQVTYEIGPVTRFAGKVRIDFHVTLDGPQGGTTSWTNDTAMHDYLKQEGGRGIVLALASDPSVSYELDAVGGIASMDEEMVAPVTYRGYWEFAVPEDAGSRFLLSYPDFSDNPAPIVVPE